MGVNGDKMNISSPLDKKPISRRRLITYAWVAAGVIALGELMGGTFAFLWPRRKGTNVETVFIAGKVNEFKVDQVISFPREKAFIVRREGGFLALSGVCTHLRCIVNWNEKLNRFECPCHGAKFDEKGAVLEGPPPRPLDLYKLHIVEGKLVVDRARPIERKGFDPSQFVKV